MNASLDWWMGPVFSETGLRVCPMRTSNEPFLGLVDRTCFLKTGPAVCSVDLLRTV